MHRCQVSARSNLHPEVSKCAQIQGLGLSKTTLRVSQCLPQSQTYTLQFPSLQNHLLSSQKVIKRHPESLYTHEVREFLTIQRPQCSRPNTHTTPPRSLSGYLIASKIRTFQGKILHLGVSTSHRPRHRERAPHFSDIISFCASRSIQCSLAAASARHLQLHQFTPQNHGSELLLCPSGRAVALRACDQAHYSESRIVRP